MVKGLKACFLKGLLEYKIQLHSFVLPNRPELLAFGIAVSQKNAYGNKQNAIYHFFDILIFMPTEILFQVSLT